MFVSFFLLLGLLVFFHFLADYPLQGDFLSKAKNRSNPIPHIPWQHALFAHSFIQAGFVFLGVFLFYIARQAVYFVLDMPLLSANEVVVYASLFFAGELVSHYMIDESKCSGEITFAQDQFYHLGFKVLWAAMAVFAL